MKLLVLASMIFCHIVDDFKFQGILAEFKQRDWWKRNAPDRLYRYDYLPALIEHAFSWTFMIHVPIFVYCYMNNCWKSVWLYVIVFVANWLIHSLVDHLKANKHKLNLVGDQVLHLIQILCTWVIYMEVNV